MAGGIGSRFWPFSRKDYPKQFLDFFGDKRSMIQMTFDRFKNVIPNENIFIVTNKNYKQLIMEQIPDIQEEQILLEPMRRNTAPCIAYATYKIKSICSEANILVVPSDHLILQSDIYIQTIKEGFDFISKNNCILTLGITPTRPETGYGYIQVNDSNTNPTKVKTFTEKPNYEMAKLFVDSGEFYWNSGMFLFNSKTIIESIENYLPEIAVKFNGQENILGTPEEQNFINDIYPTLPNISIDYGIMEKAQNVYVMIADFGWSDYGTWESLYDFSPKAENGNAALDCNSQFYDSKNNIVALNNGKLAVVQGLENYIIAESNGVLMICKKDNEQKIRQYVNDIDVRFNGEFN